MGFIKKKQKGLEEQTFDHVKGIEEVYSEAARHLAIHQQQHTQSSERACAQQDLLSALERGPTVVQELCGKLSGQLKDPKNQNSNFIAGDAISNEQLTILVDRMYEVVLVPLKTIAMTKIDYCALLKFVNTNQDNAVQVLVHLYYRAQLLANNHQDHKPLQQTPIKESQWDILGEQSSNRSRAQSKASTSGSKQLVREYRGLVETNDDFRIGACASSQYLGRRTNPFTTYDSDMDRLANDQADGHLIPPPLVLKSSQLVQSPARPVRPPRPDERESFSSSAFSGENDTPVTPLSMEFPTGDIVNHHAEETRGSLSGLDKTTNASGFSVPPSSDTPAYARDGTHSLQTQPLTQESRLLQPALEAVPSGTIPTSLKNQVFGMPHLGLRKRTFRSTHQDLALNSAGGSVAVVHHLHDLNPTFHPKRPTYADDDAKMIKKPMGKKLNAKAGLKSNLKMVNFCGGALIAQKTSAEKACKLKSRPSGLHAIGQYWGCKDCKFEGRAVQVPNDEGKVVLDIDRNVYGSNDILYRWEFLFKSHVHMKKGFHHPVHSPFGCVFCCAEGRGTPVFEGVASLLNHLQEHRSGKDRGSAGQVAKAILDRSPAVEEDFDIALPPRYI